MAEGGEVKLEPGWRHALEAEFGKPYFIKLSEFVRAEYTRGAVYPPPKNIFRAFDLCPFEATKVVILGQDPYHGAGQANGLAFAVGKGTRLPPSLQNIFKEMQQDLSLTLEQSRTLLELHDLEHWATQGVLLLNATLTVRAGAPASHAGRGWEEFTDAAVKALSDHKEHLVFILWGNYAKAKGAHIDRSKHLVIESPHPSPFSAHSGFFGSKPFSKTNDYLRQTGQAPVDWL